MKGRKIKVPGIEIGSFGIPKHTFYLHVKETEFRFNHRHGNLYRALLKLVREDPLETVCFLSPTAIGSRQYCVSE
jgi:hypothetical protein